MAEGGESRTQQLIERYAVLEELARQMGERISALEALANNISAAISALEELEKVKETVEILVPIGGSVYIKAEVGKIEKVLVEVGAEVLIEKSPEEALKYLNTRRGNILKEIERMQGQLGGVLAELEKLRGALQALTGRGTRR